MTPTTHGMPPKTLTALKASIRHWRENASAEYWDDVSIGPGACALCEKFHPHEVPPCVGCPVAERTGQPYCIGTPYEAAERAADAWGDYRYKTAVESRAVWREAAQAELDFLISLLPAGESPIPEGENQ